MQIQGGFAAAVVLHIEHEHRVAGREPAGLRVAGRPRRDDETTAHRVSPELGEHPRHLVVEARAPGLVVDRKVPPKIAVGAWNLALLVGPRIPEFALVLLEKADVGVARQEPEVLDDDVLPGNLLGREERKSPREIDLVVDVEGRESVDAGAIYRNDLQAFK